MGQLQRLPELSLRGALSAVVNSNAVADRLGATRHKVAQLIERNAKKLSDYGLVTTVVSARSVVSYQLGFEHFTYLAALPPRTGRSSTVLI